MDIEESKDNNWLPGRIMSVLFHPLLMPVYGYLIIFSVPVLGYMPFEFKRLILLIVLINNVLLPLSLIPFLKYRNLITSWSIKTRSERMTPLLFTTLLYATTSYIMYKFPIPAFLKSYIFAIFFLALALSIIYFWTTISLHSAAAGAILALVLVLSFKLNSPMTLYLVSVILISGLSLTSRLKLQSRTPAQVWYGFLAGICFTGLYLWFF